MVQLAIAIVVAAWPSASRAEEPAFLTIEQRAADFASFCHFVEQEYAYFDLKTTDWERVCRFYGPQVDDAADRAAYIELLERALGELYDQHAHLGAHTHRSHRLVPTHTDLFATWSNGRALISDVRSNSGADRAGLRPGMELVAINGESTETAVRLIEPRFLARADPAARQWALQVALAGRRDRGAPFPKPIVALAGRWTGSMGEGLAIGLNAARGSPVVGQPMARLLGAIGQWVLPHSGIVVRGPTEKRFHINGTPREAFVPCAVTVSTAAAPDQDQELWSAIDLALELSMHKPAGCGERTASDPRLPCATRVPR